MSTSAAIHPKGPRVAAKGALDWAESYLGSTVGQKILVAVTGLSLATFVLFHMIGNLKMFHGPESINQYAYFLKHDLGALIWIARGGLLGAFLLHLFLTLRLKMRSAAARPVPYYFQKSAQATMSSKTMIWTGIVIGAFVAFHLAHYTFAMVHDVPSPDGKGTVNYLDLKYKLSNGKEVHDVYRMVIAGFTTPWISALYLIAQLVLLVHLSHGLQSALTTLGLVGKRFQNAAKLLGYAIAATILAGNFAIVIAVAMGTVK
ncbi:hypothetical protein BH11PLA2_BH11PLA2_21360 [soil metagenome]